MAPCLNVSVPRCSSLASSVLLAFAVGGCSGAPGDATARGASAVSVQPGELLAQAWQYDPSASCGSSSLGAINGNDMSFSAGEYCSEGDGQAFRGFTYEQPVNVVTGGTYQLTLTLSNFNGWLGFIPTQFTASLAGVSQTAQATGDSTVTMTFTVGAASSGASTITFNARPPAGGVGPVNGGIFLTEEGCNVALSLVQTN
jgi:hypothetical protein